MNKNYAPFKGNKGKGSTRLVEETFANERQAYAATMRELYALSEEFEKLRGALRVPNSIKLAAMKKRLIRQGAKTDFGCGVERVYLRWVYNENFGDSDLPYRMAGPLVDYPEYFAAMKKQFSFGDGDKIMHRFEFDRLTLIHRVKEHIAIFNWLTDLQELQQSNRS